MGVWVKRNSLAFEDSSRSNLNQSLEVRPFRRVVFALEGIEINRLDDSKVRVSGLYRWE